MASSSNFNECLKHKINEKIGLQIQITIKKNIENIIQNFLNIHTYLVVLANISKNQVKLRNLAIFLS